MDPVIRYVNPEQCQAAGTLTPDDIDPTQKAKGSQKKKNAPTVQIDTASVCF